MRAGLAHSISFDPADPSASLAGLPEAPAVFALCAADPAAEPYLTKTTNLRRRLRRFLRGPQSGVASRRLQLAHMVDHIEYSITGSDFESALCLYQASLRAFGERARKRLRLRPPAFLRMSLDNPYPRVYATSRISKTAANALFGPFPSRAAAERYADEMLNLFLLRRCTEDLNPDPAFPGCVYSEMKMCLAPCYKGCTDERYGEESAAVRDFLATRGESKLVTLRTERDAASADLEFEKAAALHAQAQKVEAVRALAPELVQPMSKLRALVLQASANPDEVALFLFQDGRLRGPVGFSTLGMRIQNERSGSSSLFAQPMALEALPEEAGIRDQGTGISSASALEAVSTNEVIVVKPARGVLEARLEAVLAELEKPASLLHAAAVARQGHLALLKRWYYRPEVRRVGEVFFPDAGGHWPVKAILRGVGRVAAAAFSAAKP